MKLTVGLLKIKYFEVTVMTSWIMYMTSQKFITEVKLHCKCSHLTKIW